MLDRYNFLKCIPCWCSEDEQTKVSASKEREKVKRTVSDWLALPILGGSVIPLEQA